MKKHMATLLTAGLVMSISTPGHAFTSQGSVPKVATVTLQGTGSVTMSLAVKKMSDNATVTDITWTGVTLPTAWKNADTYIELTSVITAATGGIQIYTDNLNSTPSYTGVISSQTQSPAGLVDNTDRTKLLPLAWAIKDTVVGSTGPVSAEPNHNGLNGNPTDPNAFQWLYMEDKAQVANNQLAAKFQDGDPFVTVMNASGMHFGQSPTEFGAAVSPNYIYLGANFTTALTPRTYSTNKLILEAYTE